MEDKELKEALGKIGLAITSIEKNVKSIEQILRIFLVFFIITLIIGFFYGLSLSA
ncbi:MAG: hypothetical protein ACFE9I_05955 [Candidatus Hermodarchaeota archaeon]